MIAVFSFQYRGRWFVHGITIDWCASGPTKEQALIKFWSGLSLTMRAAHLEHGTIAPVLKPPPAETIKQLERIAGRPIAGILPAKATVQ